VIPAMAFKKRITFNLAGYGLTALNMMINAETKTNNNQTQNRRQNKTARNLQPKMAA
jgi:hypothetical protein